MVVKRVLKVRRYKAGYEIRTELIDSSRPVGGNFEMKSAYTPEGFYIGNSKTAHRLVVQRGIKPELADPDRAETCSIGFCERDQKWYGWSHRAIFGFGIGHVVEEGDACATSGWTDEYLEEHPEEDMRVPVGFVAESLDDAKKLAISFADAVS